MVIEVAIYCWQFSDELGQRRGSWCPLYVPKHQTGTLDAAELVVNCGEEKETATLLQVTVNGETTAVLASFSPMLASNSIWWKKELDIYVLLFLLLPNQHTPTFLQEDSDRGDWDDSKSGREQIILMDSSRKCQT